MDRQEVFKYIRFISKKVYKFSYAMMADELQAEQLFVDGINAFVLKNKEQLNQIDSEQLPASKMRKWFYLEIMQECYDLATKRWQQLQIAGSAPNGFSKLTPLQKAVLFLKEVEGQSFEAIAKICSIDTQTVIESIYSARDILIRDFNSSDKFKEGAVELS
jgi:hypothetical protein